MTLCLAAPVDPAIAQLGWHPGVFARASDLAVRLRARRSSLQNVGYDFMADPGSPVLSASAGVVAGTGREDRELSGTSYAPGYYATVRTEVPGDRPLWVHYWHLAERPRLEVGQRIAVGDLVGRVGATGLPRGARPHLLLTFSRFGPDPLRDVPAPVRTDFLGFRIEGAEQPPVRIGDWTQTPAFGGRFVSTCAPALRGLGALGSSLEYARFGRTRLSNHRPYDPEGGAPGFPWLFTGAAVAGIALLARATVR